MCERHATKRTEREGERERNTHTHTHTHTYTYLPAAEEEAHCVCAVVLYIEVGSVLLGTVLHYSGKLPDGAVVDRPQEGKELERAADGVELLLCSLVRRHQHGTLYIYIYICACE